jgi:hypothetical protein
MTQDHGHEGVVDFLQHKKGTEIHFPKCSVSRQQGDAKRTRGQSIKGGGEGAAGWSAQRNEKVRGAHIKRYEILHTGEPN